MIKTATITGRNFDLIPNNAIGLLSSKNNEPLMNQSSEDSHVLFDIVEHTGESMVLNVRAQTAWQGNTYLGAIVSEDRQEVYWVNSTKPLP